MNGGLGIDMNPRAVMSLLKNPDGIADLLTQTSETGDSPAELFSDLINIMRADVSRLAQHHGVEVDVELMPPERAGELLAGVVSGDGIALVEMFNEEAARRDAILAEVLDAAEYDEHTQIKHGLMNTAPADVDEAGE